MMFWLWITDMCYIGLWWVAYEALGLNAITDHLFYLAREWRIDNKEINSDYFGF